MPGNAGAGWQHPLVTDRTDARTGWLAPDEMLPDPKQEAFFYGLLRECLDAGIVTEAQLHEEMRHNHIRHDSLELIRRVPPLDAKPLAA